MGRLPKICVKINNRKGSNDNSIMNTNLDRQVMQGSNSGFSTYAELRSLSANARQMPLSDDLG
jgi:hypothetical protein